MSASDSPSTTASWQMLLEASRSRSLEGDLGTSIGDPGGVRTPAREFILASPRPVRDSSDVLVVLVLVERGPGEDVCGGKIGTNSARFCVESCKSGTTMCQYASHSAKANIQKFPAYYIHHPKGTTAFCEPCLPVPPGGFPDAITEALMGRRTSTEWAGMFPTLETAAMVEDSNQQVDMIARVERGIQMGPTPSFKRRGPLFPGEGEGRNAQAAIDLQSTATDLDHPAFMAREGLSMEDACSHMADYWNEMIDMTVNQASASSQFEKEVQSYMEEVDDKVVRLGSIVGGKPANSVLPLTVWSSVDSVAQSLEVVSEQVKTVTEELSELKGRENWCDIEIMMARVGNISDEVNKLNQNELNSRKEREGLLEGLEYVTLEFSDIESKVNVLAQELAGLQHKVNGELDPQLIKLSEILAEVKENKSGITTLRFGNDEWKAGQKDLEQEIENVRVVLTSLAGQISGTSRNDSRVNSGSVPEVQVRNEVADLKRQIQVMALSHKGLEELIATMQRSHTSEVNEAKGMLMEEFRRLMVNQPNTPALSSQMSVEMYGLRRTVDELTKQVGEMKSNTLSGLTGYPRADNEDMRAALALLTDQVNVLTMEYQSIRSEMITQGVSFGGFTFSKEDDYSDFVLKNFPGSSYGYCVDFISMLELGAVDSNRTSETALKMMKVTSGAGFGMGNEAIIFTSFGTFFPALFGPEHDPLDPFKKMGKMTSMFEWDPRNHRSGRKVNINNALTTLKRVMDPEITSQLRSNSVASIFFRQLITSTLDFWNAFHTWINEFENEMCALEPGDNPDTHKAQIWSLICWMMHSMFREMAVRRATGMAVGNMDRADKARVASAILQGTLGCHKFMQELVDLQFIKHPIFSSTMVEFLITNKAPYALVQELRVHIKRLDSTVRGLQSERDRKAGGGGAANR